MKRNSKTFKLNKRQLRLTVAAEVRQQVESAGLKWICGKFRRLTDVGLVFEIEAHYPNSTSAGPDIVETYPIDEILISEK